MPPEKLTRDQAVELLKGGEEGIKKWNEYRDNGGEIPDLSGIELNSSDLTGAHLWKARLCDVKLENAILNGADLKKAELTNAELANVKLNNANLYGIHSLWWQPMAHPLGLEVRYICFVRTYSNL